MTPGCEDVAIDFGHGQPMRAHRRGVARKGGKLVLHLHGGAFQPGFLASGRIVAGLLADSGAAVITPDYPAGPEHPFPRALEATYILLRWLCRDQTRLHYARRLRDSGVPVREHMIPAPTRWPDVLTDAAPPDAPWVAETRDAIAAFLAERAVSPNSP